MNQQIQTVIVAPMTTTIRNYPTRVNIEFQEIIGQVALDQIRAIDKSRFIKRLGRIKENESRKVLQVLQELFVD